MVDGQVLMHRGLVSLVQLCTTSLQCCLVLTAFESPISPSYAAVMPFSAQSLQVTWYAPEDRVCEAPGRSDLHSGHCGTRHPL